MSDLNSARLYIFLLLIQFPIVGNLSAQQTSYTSIVNPFIGTDGHGHTFPGATMPFGMVQLSPDTRLDGWDGCSGYHYTDSIIYGFSHTHLSGTGVSDYGDILLMPSAEVPFLKNYHYKSPFSKKNEFAEPGYYKVLLDKGNIEVELTATPRVGIHKYQFPEQDRVHVVLDLAHRDPVIASSLEIISDTEIRGMRRSNAWATDQLIYFHIQFSKPIQESGIASSGNWTDAKKVQEGKELKAYFSFDGSGKEALIVKTGISATGFEGALKNLQAEAPGWNFESYKKACQDAWNKQLGKIRVEGGSDSEQTTFYSALYHCMVAPNLFSDVDKAYRGMDKKNHIAENHDQYTIFSLWDTYRGLHPLMTIIETQRTRDFIHTFLSHYETGGLLPVWELAGNETYCMIGYHSVSVIYDAWKKGIRGFDANKALAAMVNSARKNHFGLEFYKDLGVIPGDMEHESVSKTLEYAYDDWCIAMMAKDLGNEAIYTEFIQRAQYYKNIFDPKTGFMRPRVNGGWKSPFDPTEVDFHFTEANSWQYSFYVPHDVEGLAKLHKGEENLIQKIDELFETQQGLSGREQADITGLIGQYAHGNEPSHHMAYLYNYLGQPWKTQQRVRQIMDEQYSDIPDGLSGNEDCGQMSAWYVLSALGFYPVCPGNTQYSIGTPLFPKASIHLENGNIFTIEAPGAGTSSPFVQSMTLNGNPYTKSFLEHADITQGGVLRFEMSTQANLKSGVSKGDRPVSSISAKSTTVIPYLEPSERVFKDQMEISIHKLQPGSEILYRLNAPGKKSGKWRTYTSPIKIKKSSDIQAKCLSKDGSMSQIVEGSYHKFNSEYSIQVLSKPHPQYTGGGFEGLIDGLHGTANWRLGGWQGYWGQDFEAIIDLGKIKTVKEVSAGFAQDLRSWIVMPSEVEYFISNDGFHFTSIGKVSHQVKVEDYELQKVELKLRSKAKGRFLKIKAKNFGKLPEWHLGAGGDAYIFVDEINVR
jgi:predicted alpha-1,2-mannosidase